MNIYLLSGLIILGYFIVGFLFIAFVDFKDYDRKSTKRAYIIFFFFGIFGLHNLYLKYELKYVFHSLVVLVPVVMIIFFREKSYSINYFLDNQAFTYSLIIMAFIFLIDLILMPFWVFKSNYSEKIYKEPDIEFELRKCQEDLGNINFRLTNLFKTDGIL
ncbi:TM2 domain-containing protein [Belliella baltica DSM 15883]|uniref:TM2 domain-containing protein n=1 Tax=Belliella baltica (strain DSM 15883 / CIP 108006 / LMG 21964 / BA134) TaxID=866536 RepID=I3Z825_BELBD|nr:NINE protein [Belliella baltica]AFL85393.1 TM2 domain-containing protein [Belliella baltica DSM 15883]